MKKNSHHHSLTYAFICQDPATGPPSVAELTPALWEFKATQSKRDEYGKHLSSKGDKLNSTLSLWYPHWKSRRQKLNVTANV